MNEENKICSENNSEDKLIKNPIWKRILCGFMLVIWFTIPVLSIFYFLIDALEKGIGVIGSVILCIFFGIGIFVAIGLIYLSIWRIFTKEGRKNAREAEEYAKWKKEQKRIKRQERGWWF